MKNRNTFLFHYGSFTTSWTMGGELVQCGPFIENESKGINIGLNIKSLESMVGKNPDELKNLFEKKVNTLNLNNILEQKGFKPEGILLHFIDAFLLKGIMPLRQLSKWKGPKILICGDLHHGNDPIQVLKEYLDKEFHDSVVLAFNPSLIDNVRKNIAVPVHATPPGFFRYPVMEFNSLIKPSMVHIGALDEKHTKRKDIIKSLLKRQLVPFYHTRTNSTIESSRIYNQSAVTLNIPLNNDLNQRFFEIIYARGRQIVMANPDSLLGPIKYLKDIPGVYWAKSIEEVEELALSIINDCIDKRLPKLLSKEELSDLLEPSLNNLKKIWLGKNSYPIN